MPILSNRFPASAKSAAPHAPLRHSCSFFFSCEAALRFPLAVCRRSAPTLSCACIGFRFQHKQKRRAASWDVRVRPVPENAQLFVLIESADSICRRATRYVTPRNLMSLVLYCTPGYSRRGPVSMYCR
jgi:hypothetical protein